MIHANKTQLGVNVTNNDTHVRHLERKLQTHAVVFEEFWIHKTAAIVSAAEILLLIQVAAKPKHQLSNNSTLKQLIIGTPYKPIYLK